MEEHKSAAQQPSCCLIILSVVDTGISIESDGFSETDGRRRDFPHVSMQAQLLNHLIMNHETDVALARRTHVDGEMQVTKNI